MIRIVRYCYRFVVVIVVLLLEYVHTDSQRDTPTTTTIITAVITTTITTTRIHSYSMTIPYGSLACLSLLLKLWFPPGMVCDFFRCDAYPNHLCLQRMPKC
jgi:hypothetical protein